MSQERKMLKIVSLLFVLVGLACLVTGIMLVAGGTLFAGIALVAAGAMSLVTFAAGVKGANRPSSVSPVKGASVADVVLLGASAALALLGEPAADVAFTVAPLVGILLALAAFFFAGKVEEQARR